MNTLITGTSGLIGAVAGLLLLGIAATFAIGSRGTKAEVLTETLAEPLDGAQAAQVEINVGDGNLIIDRLAGGEDLLANGTLEYTESQGLPTRTHEASNGEARFTLQGGVNEQIRWRMPWSACNSETNWQVHLNPGVQTNLTAHSNGGNVTLDLSGMAVTQVVADTGGGNMKVVLPEDAANLNVSAQSGAGNVEVSLPAGLAARIHAKTGLGKAIVDARFTKVDATTWQSPDFESAAERIDITAGSGAGNVIISSR